MQKVNDFVLQEFSCARNNHLPFHDIDIQILAMIASKLYELEKFTSSHSYVAQFKRRNRIKSRKYTKLVSKVYEIDVENILSNAIKFVADSKPLMSYFNDDFTINTDQSGFHYEVYCSHTLSSVGDKQTLLYVESIPATTHSYTIQYAYTKSGKFLPKIFLCLQELNGNFGSRVNEETEFLRNLCPNVVIKCSKSGKMDKILVKQFNEEVLKS